MGDARTQRHSAHPSPLTGRASLETPLCSVADFRFHHPRQLGELPVRLHFVTIVAIGHLPPAASVGAECAGFSARCLRLVHGTALPQTLLRSRDVWGARTALESRDLAIGARAGAQRTGAPRRGGRRGARGGVGRARTGRPWERPSRRGGGLSAARAPRRAAAVPSTAPLPSRRVEASRGRCRWCGGGAACIVASSPSGRDTAAVGFALAAASGCSAT